MSEILKIERGLIPSLYPIEITPKTQVEITYHTNELIRFLEQNGGFYFIDHFPTDIELEYAVAKRKQKSDTDWTVLYENPLNFSQYSYHRFISDASLFDTYESYDFPCLLSP